jgi:hypothetical protein
MIGDDGGGRKQGFGIVTADGGQGHRFPHMPSSDGAFFCSTLELRRWAMCHRAPLSPGPSQLSLPKK